MEKALVKILEDGIKTVVSDMASGNMTPDVTASDTMVADVLSLLSRRLQRLYDEISLFNPQYGLVNAQGEELVVRHILDCLAPASVFTGKVNECIKKAAFSCGCDISSSPHGSILSCDSSSISASAADPAFADGNISVADLGSGAGLPGLVLASLFDRWSFSLVERMGRRAGFLRNTVAAMNLNLHVQILQQDLAEVQNSFDIITFRAFRPFKDIICDIDRLLKPNGLVFAYKSSNENIAEEVSVIESYTGTAFTHDVIDYDVPYLDAKRRMLVLLKTNCKTPCEAGKCF